VKPQPDWHAYAALREIYPGLAKEALMKWHRAPATVRSLSEALKPYFNATSSRKLPRNAKFSEAKSLVKRMFAFSAPVKVLYTDELENVKVHANKSAGINFPGMTKGEALPRAVRKARMLAHFSKTTPAWRVTRQTPPCKISARLHLSKRSKSKVRPVWVYPLEMTLVELLFAQPLLDGFSKRMGVYPTPYMKGIDIIGDLPALLSRLDRHDRQFIGKDVSRLDSSVHPDLIHWVFDEVLEQNLLFGTSSYYEKRKRNMWSFVKDYFLNTPFVSAHGLLYKKSHGVPSGSMFTGIVDTVVCTLFDIYDFLCQDVCPIVRPMVVGDDTLDVIDQNSNWSSSLAKEVYRSCCVTLNSEKSYFGSLSEVPFLGHFHNGNRVRRDEVEVAARLIWPERQLGPLWLTYMRACMLDVDSGARFWWFTILIQRLRFSIGVFVESHDQRNLQSILSWWFALTGQRHLRLPSLSVMDRYGLVSGFGILA